MDEKEAARIHQEILDLAKSNQHRITELEVCSVVMEHPADAIVAITSRMATAFLNFFII